MENIPRPKSEPSAEEQVTTTNTEQTPMFPEGHRETESGTKAKWGKALRAIAAGAVFLGGSGVAPDADAGKLRDHVRVDIRVPKNTPQPKPYWEMDKAEKARYNAAQQAYTSSAEYQRQMAIERAQRERVDHHRAERYEQKQANMARERAQLIETLAVPGGSLQIAISPASAERMRKAGVIYKNGQLTRGIERIDLTKDVTNSPVGQFEIFMDNQLSGIIITHGQDAYSLDLNFNIIDRPRR